MVTGTYDQQPCLLVNIYAPSMGAARIRFFQQMQQIPVPTDTTIICGGDFNCVERTDLDRSGTDRRADIGAKQLTQLLLMHGLIDANTSMFPDERNNYERQTYMNTQHTYQHATADGARTTSRIDRWYISTEARHLIRGVTVVDPPCHTDHKGVLLELHSPRGVLRLRKRSKVYPAPEYAQAATANLIATKLAEVGDNLSTSSGSQTISIWDNFKAAVVAEMVAIKRAAQRRSTGSFRQKIKRLKQRMQLCHDHTQHGYEKQKELQQEIRRVQELRRASKRRSIQRANAFSSRQTTKHFFNRICTKHGDNTIGRLVPTVQRGRQEHDKANIFADSWAQILNGAANDKEGIEHYLKQFSSTWAEIEMKDIDDDIREEKVNAAIRRCKRGKACGPDALYNDWYQDHIEQLTPMLTKLFNQCMETGSTPQTFNEAYIFSISKGGDRTNPMNYRPIALLNTDYKIFTRILAWRLRKYIAQLVHSTQAGFVPGRTIHETIDLFEAAKLLCKHNSKLTKAQVLLLDFAKAYDSLDRDFLMAVLKAKGLPPKFCAIVKAIHDGTTVKFMANGQLSRALQVTSGIRQGCPLAPLLFILAVDILYDEIAQEKRLRGIQLGEHDGNWELKVAGYADDTAIYIADKTLQLTAVEAVARFTSVSGLKLNINKSVAIQLGTPSADEEDNTTQQTTTQAAIEETEQTRYLGHIAGTGSTTELAWTRAFEALTARLQLACSKTNTTQQRAAIAAAIIVPKLTYIARHAWPTTNLIKEADRRIRNYVWNISFTDPDVPPKGWVSADVAELSPMQGGLGVPNIRTELIALGTATVAKWALEDNTRLQRVGDILRGQSKHDDPTITPTRRKPPTLISDEIWTTGQPWVELFYSEGDFPEKPGGVGVPELRRQLKHSNGLTTQWTTAGLHTTFKKLAEDVMLPMTRWRRQVGGIFHKSALHRLPLKSIQLTDTMGQRGNWKNYEELTRGRTCKRLGDLVDIVFVRMGEIVFRPTWATLPLPSLQAHRFRDLSLAVLAAYPELAFAGIEEDTLTVHHATGDSHHTFIIVADSNSKHVAHTWGSTTTTIQWQQDNEHLSAAVARFLDQPQRKVRIEPHPLLTRMKPLWTGGRRWTQFRKQYKHLISAARKKAAKKRIQQAANSRKGEVLSLQRR